MTTLIDKKTKLKKILWIGLVLLLAFLTAEVALRHFWTPPITTRDRSLVRHHSLFGWEKAPFAKARHKNRYYEVFEKYNSRGLRGPEYSYEKPINKKRILILGDSHAEGRTVKFDDLFSEVFQREFNNKSTQQIEVINAGTGSYSTDQQLLFFENEGVKYKPDITISTFTFDDVWCNTLKAYSYWDKPRFKLNEGALELLGVPVAKSEAPNYSKFRLFIWKNFYVGKFVYKKITKSSFYNLLSRLGLAPFSFQYRVYQKKETPLIKYAWLLTEAILLELKQKVESSGSKLIIYHIPDMAFVYPEQWEKRKNKFNFSNKEWDLSLDSQKLEAICKKHGIDFINPIDVFRQSSANQQLYSFDDEHWLPEGHELAGEVLVDYFINNKLGQ